MTPLQTLASLIQRQTNAEQRKLVTTLAAREDLRLDGFWEDLAAPEIWGEKDSVAALVWEDPQDAAAFQKTLFLIAEDLELRGLGSAASSAWLARFRKESP